VGIERRKPLTAMRETVTVLRRLFNMERVTFHGEFIHVDGIELDVVMQTHAAPCADYDRCYRR
jgi:5,10-methylenetetrahydromethanopterin reductase